MKKEKIQLRINKVKKNNYSAEYIKYKNKNKSKKVLIAFASFSILFLLIFLWEYLGKKGLINTFIMSSPSRIMKTIKELYLSNQLFYHIGTTLKEAVLGFLIATLGGTLIAIFLWWNDTIRRIIDPYLVVLNSLPKIALGPMIIIWVGIGMGAIIVMDVLIMIVITILTMLNAFNSADKNKMMLLKSMNASKYQILTKLVVPGSVVDFVSLLKINVGLTWVGTIMGEYLVSRAGLGYLIVYGGQVFKLDLVMTSTVILCALAGIMYFLVSFLEKRVSKSHIFK